MITITVVLIYIIASFTQGVTGFGFGIFSMPLISMIYTPGIAIGINAILGTINCTYNYILLRKHVNYRKSMRFLMIGSLFIPFGAYFLVKANEQLIFIIMGLTVICVTLHTMRSSRQYGESYLSRKKGTLFSIMAGMVAGAFASPGPILAPFMFAHERDPYVAKANLQFIFTVMSGVIIISHILARNLTMHTLGMAAPYIPVVFLFTKLGSILSFRMKKTLFKKLETAALLVLGTYILCKNLLILCF